MPPADTRPGEAASTGADESDLPAEAELVRALPAGVELASPAFVEIGEVVELDGYGSLEDVIHLTDPAAVELRDGHLIATTTGVSCALVRYREVDGENDVQSVCLFVIEHGACGSLPAFELDITALSERASELGPSDLFASGAGAYYRVCVAGAGTLRLETTERPAPPLHAVVVDALAIGPYAVGDDELDHVRDTRIPTTTGVELTPPLIITVTREITTLALDEAGGVTINDEDCAETPSCSDRVDLVARGDTLRIGYGLEPDAFLGAMEAAPASVRDAFVAERIGQAWSSLAHLQLGAIEAISARIISIEILGQLLEEFDGSYDLSDRSVRVGLWPYWLATRPVTDFCHPDRLDDCEDIERRVAAFEVESIERWRGAGFNLWWTGHLDASVEGVRSLADRRPAVELFAGVDAIYLVNESVPIEQRVATMGAMVEDLASVAGTETPILISMAGPPVTANTGGEFCEADVCPSDFGAAYAYAEAILIAAEEFLTPTQFTGFGVALFDGSHVDIRQPIEDFGGFELNRLGETAAFNPVLNIWRTR